MPYLFSGFFHEFGQDRCPNQGRRHQLPRVGWEVDPTSTVEAVFDARTAAVSAELQREERRERREQEGKNFTGR
jgi:hypothetical protein